MILLKAGIGLEELEKEERQDMCEAIKAMIGEGKEIGKSEGQMLGCMQEVSTFKELGYINKIKRDFSLTEEETKKYMEEYCK